MAIFGMKVSGQQTIVTIDIKKFQTILKARMEVQARQALREWFRVALDNIPQYTGTARGTLTPVGRLVRRAVGSLGAIKGRAKGKKWITYRDRSFRTGPEAGADYADATLDTKLDGLNLTSSFVFTNTLPYVGRNDEKGAPPGFTLPSNPPWNSHDKAAAAWKKYLLTVGNKKLLIPAQALTVKVVRIR
jgi:hypothetical protein